MESEIQPLILLESAASIARADKENIAARTNDIRFKGNLQGDGESTTATIMLPGTRFRQDEPLFDFLEVKILCRFFFLA
jgi:hypothetical protein